MRYSAWLYRTLSVQDYPSVGQIAQMLNDQEVSVIFAVEGQRLNTYTVIFDLDNAGSVVPCSICKLND